MKLTNLEMDNYLKVLGMLHEKHELGWAIAKNIHILSDAAREYLELKQSLIAEYGEDTENGGKSIDKKNNPEGFAAYEDAMGDIPNIKQDVNVFQIDEKTFRSGELTSAQMAMLMWMVKGEDKKDE